MLNKKIKIPITGVAESTWAYTSPKEAKKLGESELSKHELQFEGPRLNSHLIKEMDRVLKQYGLWNKIKRLWRK